MNTLYTSIPGSSLVGRIGPMARVLLTCGSLALLSACESEPDSHVVSAPPPPAPATVSTVTTQTTSAPTTTQQTYVNGVGQTVTTTTQQPTNTYVVMQTPPALQQEVVLVSPGADYKWVPGYWTWRDNHYEWMAGHWQLPPRSDSVWIAPHYEPESGGGYRYYEGYWN